MATNYDILSTIIENEKIDDIPALTQSNIADVGNAITTDTVRRNKFFTALLNKVALTFYNGFKADNLIPCKDISVEYGETVEEIFIPKITGLSPRVAKTSNDYKDQFDEFKNEVKKCLHAFDYEVYYPYTIDERELKKAFNSRNGLTQLMSSIAGVQFESSVDDIRTNLISALERGYAGATDDQKIEIIGEDMESTAKIAIKKIKDLSRTIKFNSTKYNKLGVETKTPINDQILLVNHKLLSFMETEVIANTFNRSVFDIPANIVEFEGFNDTSIVAVLYSKNALLNCQDEPVYTHSYDAIKRTENTFLHRYGFASVSPFENVVYITYTPAETESEDAEPEDED